MSEEEEEEEVVEKYQLIVLILSDGRKIQAVVPAFIEEGQYITIKSAQVTHPQPLPAGASFGTLQGN